MGDSTALIPVGHGPIAPRSDGQTLIDDWLAAHSQRTRREYRRDLLQFGKWCNLAAGDAVTGLLLSTMGDANQALHRYKADMKATGLSPATINRRLSAVRSIVKLARRFGKVAWTLEVEGEKHVAYRDTRGPTEEEIGKVITHVSRQDSRLASARDPALVMLMFGQGLRRNEVAQLDLTDLDVRGNRLRILGKGRVETEWITLSAETLGAMRGWLAKRGRAPGPLFQSMTRGGALSGNRLQGDGLHYLLQRWGKNLGMVLRPHGLRHTFVNVALEATSGNLHAVRKAARWRKLDTVISYDDNRTDVAGDVARKVGARMARVVEDAVKDTPEVADATDGRA